MKKNAKGFCLIVAYLLLATFIYYLLNTKSLIGIDDGNIYFVYMRNLAEGFGFVFNQNGEKVEGFTSLLWTLAGALFFKISQNYNVILLIFNLSLLSIVLYRVKGFLNLRFSDYSSKIFPFLLCVLLVLPGFIEWTILSLLETGLWCFLLTMPAINILEYNKYHNKQKHYLKLSIYIILLVVCRPEAMLWIPFFIVFNTYKEFLLSDNDKIVFRNLWLLLVFIVFSSALILWRIDYFGYPFPNTYYAKVSENKSHNLFLGLKYVVGFLLYNPVAFIILVLNLFSFFYLLRTEQLKLFIHKENFDFLFLLGIFLLSLFIPFYTGGDYFANYRFIQPTIPLILLSVCFTCFFQKLNWKKVNGIYSFSILLLVFFTSFHNYNIIKKHESKLAHEFIVAREERMHSDELNKLFSVAKKYPSQGVMAAGGCCYIYKGETQDMLALNNVKMAHAPQEYDSRVMKNHAAFRKRIFFDQKPDLFWIAGDFVKKNQPIENVSPITISNFNKIVFKHIENLPQFNQQYVSCIITRKGYDKYLRIYANRNFLNSLGQNYTVRIQNSDKDKLF